MDWCFRCKRGCNDAYTRPHTRTHTHTHTHTHTQLWPSTSHDQDTRSTNHQSKRRSGHDTARQATTRPYQLLRAAGSSCNRFASKLSDVSLFEKGVRDDRSRLRVNRRNRKSPRPYPKLHRLHGSRRKRPKSRFPTPPVSTDRDGNGPNPDSQTPLPVSHQAPTWHEMHPPTLACDPAGRGATRVGCPQTRATPTCLRPRVCV